MLQTIARTPPKPVTKGHPKTTPPAAAPIRNNAVMPPIHNAICRSSSTWSKSCKAGRPTSGMTPC